MPPPECTEHRSASAGTRELAATAADARHTVCIVRGSFYFACELCDRYFKGIESIAPLQRGGCVYLLPLWGTSAGGLLLKLRNARGDRVTHALEFLLTLGIHAESPERRVNARWSSALGGLLLQDLASLESPGGAVATRATAN